jgi:aspartyl-tRNA(Asn)/glutamyl-tRNA(Gln) amidotransferase subunit A
VSSEQASPTRRVTQALARMDELATTPWANLVASRNDQQALAEAALLEAELRTTGSRGPLHGVPIVVKDNIDVAGMPTRLGSARRAGVAASTTDAACVTALREGGAVVVAKAHLHELAYGATDEINADGPARNPRDPARMTGGSSSGSAALVALGVVPLAIGTDTGCSVRTPAALCGVVGLKPGIGAVSTRGVIPLSPSLDHVGLIGRDVDVVAAGWGALESGGSESDPVAMRGLRVVVPTNAMFRVHDPSLGDGVERAADALRSVGVDVLAMDIPGLEDVRDLYASVVGSEAAAQWVLDGVASRDLQEATRTRLEAQAKRPDRHYQEARRQHLRVRAEVCRWMREEARIDALLLSTTPTRAPLVGQTNVSGESVNDALLRNCVPFSVLGLPAITTPIPDEEGLPGGLQVVAVSGPEQLALQVASVVGAQPW